MRILLSFLAFCGLVFGLEVGELNLKTDNISGKFNEEMIGTVTAVASIILMLASLGGVIAFAIKLFVFYLYGAA